MQTALNSDARTGSPMAMPPLTPSPFGSVFPFPTVREPIASLDWQRHSISPRASSCIRLI